MKLTITIPDEQFDQLEAVAKQQGKLPAKHIADSLQYVLQFNPLDNQILLNGKAVSDISMTVGGKTLRTAEDVVKLFKDNFKVTVSGIEFNLETEDAQALKDQYTGFSAFLTYDAFVRDTINEALSQYLWGSTRGVLAY